VCLSLYKRVFPPWHTTALLDGPTEECPCPPAAARRRKATRLLTARGEAKVGAVAGAPPPATAAREVCTAPPLLLPGSFGLSFPAVSPPTCSEASGLSRAFHAHYAISSSSGDSTVPHSLASAFSIELDLVLFCRSREEASVHGGAPPPIYYLSPRHRVVPAALLLSLFSWRDAIIMGWRRAFL